MGKNGIDKEVGLFLELLRAGLWEGSYELPSAQFEGLTASSWGRLIATARKQTVMGLIYKGICSLPDSCLPPVGLLMNLAAEVEAVERRNMKMEKAQSSLLSFFHERGLEPVVMKGRSVAKYYADPAVRECGDIDLYFPGGGFNAAAQALKEAGARIENEPDGSISYSWEGVVVEHHPRFLDISNPFKQKELRKIEAHYGADSPMMELLLLNTHILKHSLGKGIGMRQFCDFARAWDALTGGAAVCADEYEKICRALGIGRWTGILFGFIGDWLSREAGGGKKTGKLLCIVLENGNFGSSGRGGKAATAAAFLRNAAFGLSLAPLEYLGLTAELTLGQLR